MNYQALCEEQAEIIEQLVRQNRRLINALDQFISIEREEEALREIEDKISGRSKR